MRKKIDSHHADHNNNKKNTSDAMTSIKKKKDTHLFLAFHSNVSMRFIL